MRPFSVSHLPPRGAPDAGLRLVFRPLPEVLPFVRKVRVASRAALWAPRPAGGSDQAWPGVCGPVVANTKSADGPPTPPVPRTALWHAGSGCQDGLAPAGRQEERHAPLGLRSSCPWPCPGFRKPEFARRWRHWDASPGRPVFGCRSGGTGKSLENKRTLVPSLALGLPAGCPGCPAQRGEG